MVGLDVGGLLFRMDSDVGLLVAVAESDAISTIVRSDVGPVVVLHVLVDALGDDRFSPGVSCCEVWNHLSCIVPPRTEDWDRLEFHWDSSVDCIPDGVNAWDHPVGKLLLDGVLISHPSDILFRLVDLNCTIRLCRIFGCKICGDYLCLIRNCLIFRIRATWTSALGRRGLRTTSGT